MADPTKAPQQEDNPYLKMMQEDAPAVSDQASATSQGESQQPEGFWHALGSTFGLTSEDAQAHNQEIRQHPIASLAKASLGPAEPLIEGAVNGGKRILGELGEVYHGVREGNPYKAAEHEAYALPFLGEGIKRGVEQLGPGEHVNRAELGTVLGTAAQTAPMVLGATDAVAPSRSLIGKVPTRAHAGEVLESIKSQVGNQPVTLTRSLPILERAQQLSERGHGTVGALDNLYKRVNTVNPLDYAEARDRASAISGLTGQDKLAASKSLQRESKIFSHAFNDDIGDTAAQAGRGEDYRDALNEYRRASQIRSGLIGAAKYGIPAAVGTGIIGKVIRNLLP